ncbi:hypothetical protein CYMTET_17647 [Cymbomonas tetramitiformis]|uniref:Retrovirus-related Pol polyprotein from transposon TNT 1-94-like beta-barrel domain-containing protein n=1 Tax=Cymbomonas tetramitiformis TaxID=36881 RepID=A0AAE0G9P6_9CHLO|nr:hypothetical protein CYMTET_17647 [Cymbomonas tetramitiformis]
MLRAKTALLDSGASTHVFSTPEVFAPNFDNSDVSTFRVVHGQTISSIGVGTVVMHKVDANTGRMVALHLGGSHCIPGQPFNLISAVALEDADFTMRFGARNIWRKELCFSFTRMGARYIVSEDNGGAVDMHVACSPYLEQFGPFEVELFTSQDNHRLDYYYSLEDSAFDLDWSGKACYGNPPYENDIILRRRGGLSWCCTTKDGHTVEQMDCKLLQHVRLGHPGDECMGQMVDQEVPMGIIAKQYADSKTAEYCQQHGIEQIHGSPYLHENQARVEGSHRSVQAMARALLMTSGFDYKELRYVRHSEVSSVYLLHNPETDKVVRSGMVTFSEKLDKLGKLVTTWDLSVMVPLKTNFMVDMDADFVEAPDLSGKHELVDRDVFLQQGSDEVLAVVKVQTEDLSIWTSLRCYLHGQPGNYKKLEAGQL